MATQGPLSGGTFTSLAVFFGDTHWSNPSNAASSNNGHATVALNSGQSSHLLTVTNFGFSIPSGATIDGILVEVERKASAGNCYDDLHTLTKDGESFSDSSDLSADGLLPTSDTYISVGGASELWGTTWTAEEINASTFGFMYQVTAEANGRTISVDHIRITVYYTPGAGGQTIMQRSGGVPGMSNKGFGRSW